jgi:DNA-binding NarL/FixJ family response regulator
MKVLVLDDHEAIRGAVVRWVQVVAPEFQCVEFSGVGEAQLFVKRNRVDYAVCDLEVRQGCDTSLLDILADLNFPVLVFSSHVNKVLIQELDVKRVLCYVSKTSVIQALKAGLEALFTGRSYQCPLVQATLTRKFDTLEPRRLTLSKGQKQVLALLVLGHTREDVANLLCNSISTINNHIYRAREVNDCRDLTELLRRFRFWDHG